MTPITLPEINAVYWSPKLGAVGEVVTDADDINQCIRIILQTPKGSDPHRPDFGARLGDYIDRPINTARPHLIREATQAVLDWEPRIELVSVKVFLAQPELEIQQVVIQVVWRLPQGINQQVTEVLLTG